MLIKYLDLFSGIGGFRYAFTKSCKKRGINCRSSGFSEIDKNSIKTYTANFSMDPGEKDFGDISQITGNGNVLPDFDFLFAGFPCQPFSVMGKGKGFADTRGTLFFHIEKILASKKPSFFLLENVRGLLHHNNGETYNSIINILEEKLGYSTTTWMLNSSDYGVPQTRRRAYILGFKDKKLKEKVMKPNEVNLTKTKTPTTWHILEKETDEKYYLSERLLKTILSNGTGGFKSKSEINKHIARPLCATMHKMHRACQDNYFSDAFIGGKYNNQENKIIENKKARYKVRRLTPKEAFRLHGFPDKFCQKAMESGVSDTQLYRQAGNAVTVNVVEKIMDNVLSVM